MVVGVATGPQAMAADVLGGQHGVLHARVPGDALGKIDGVRQSLKTDPSQASRPDGQQRTPLDYAAATGQVEIAQFLIDHGAPLFDAKRSATDVPLHHAIRHDHPLMVKLLLDAGSSPDTVRSSLETDAKANILRGSDAHPAVHMAIDTGNVEIVKLLLLHHSDLKVTNTYTQSPLHYAALFGKAEIVTLLIKGGADVKATTDAFYLPCGSGQENTPQLDTPLHFAAARGNPDTIKALLTGGADIDAPDVNGLTPLMSTIAPPIYTGIDRDWQLKNIEQLIASGAKVNLENKRGQTVLDLARDDKGDDEKPPQAVIDLLLKHGAKPGHPKPEEKTAVDDEQR